MRGDSVVADRAAFMTKLAGDWRDTEVDLPSGNWTNHLTGERLHGGPMGLADLMRRFPVALLAREGNRCESSNSVGAIGIEVALVTANERVEMCPGKRGWWRVDLSPEQSRADYGFSLDGGPTLPDPRSPFQPHGLTWIVAPGRSFGVPVASRALARKRRCRPAHLRIAHRNVHSRGYV